MKKIIAVILASIMLFSSALSLSSCASLDSTKKEATVVMTVGGIDVTYEVYRYFALNLRAQLDGGDAKFWENNPDSEKLIAGIEEDTEEALRELYAIFSCGKKYDTTEENPAIADLIEINVDQFIETYKNKSAYLKEIKKFYMNHAVVSLMIASEIIEEELFFALQNAGEISKDEDYLKSYFKSDEFIRVKQVLIAFDSDGDGLEDGTREEKHKLAEEVLAKARAGEDFDSLVREYGNDLMMFNNTDGYYFTRGVYLEEFEEASFALEIGEISDIVETSEGYSIILRCEKEDAYLDKHFKELKDVYGRAKFNLIISSHAETMEIVKNDKFEELCDIATMK